MIDHLPGRRQKTPPDLAARAVLILAAVFAAAIAPAGAQIFGKNKVQYTDFDWHVYKAPHFDVYYYPEEEKFLSQVVSYSESAYLYLSKAFDHEPKFRIPLIYYKTHAEFEQTNVILSSITEGVGAFAEPLEHRMVLPIDNPPDKLYQLITHELTHIFEYSILFQDSLGRAVRGNPPGWLMEGLASYMAKDEDSIDRMVIRDAVIHGLVPPVTKIGQTTFLTYRYGHAAFDFIESKWGPEGIRTFLSEFRKVLLSANIEKAIKEAFGLEADEFDRLYQRYLRQKYFPTLLQKAEPEDYGKEIGIKLPGVYTFSPVLSPSGDLVAVLTNRHLELDVVILSAKDGEVIQNLTKGFTNDYDYVDTGAFDGKNDLAWSPDGDLLAFFVRKENVHQLLIVNAITGKRVKALPAKTANPESPAFSPDGKKIVFAGNRGGVVDIFEMDVETGEIRNITSDEYYDSGPSWSADGKSILYNRRVGPYEKIFLLDYEDPSRKTQVTFGESSEIMPALSRDGKRVFYVSDIGEGIFNLHALDLESGEVRHYTDVAGGIFSPQDRPAEEGKSRVVTTAFAQGRFRLFETDVTKPLKIVTPTERAKETGELTPFEPPLKLTLDETEKSPHEKATYHIETTPNVLVGVASDGTFIGDAQMVFSDLLGDQRFWLFLTSVANFQNTNAGYINMKSRLHHFYQFRDYRDFLVVPTSSTTFTRVEANRATSLAAGAVYPLSSAYRVEASLGVIGRDIIDSALAPFDDPATPPGKKADFAFFTNERLKSTSPFAGVSLVGDTVRYNPWGPWHGKRFDISVEGAPIASGDEATFVNYSLDYRAYGKMTRRSTIAWRLRGLVTEGEGATLFGIGGYNQLRGFAYREFIGDRAVFSNLEIRFPLVDDLRLPFGSIRWIRGLLFFDVGAAWTQDGYFFDRELGNINVFAPTGCSQNQDPNAPPCFFGQLATGVFRDFKFYDSDENRFRDARGSYGLGFNFRLGFLDLNWTFAKTLPYSQIDRSTCQATVRNLGPGDNLATALNTCGFEKIGGSNWRGDFYIGYEF